MSPKDGSLTYDNHLSGSDAFKKDPGMLLDSAKKAMATFEKLPSLATATNVARASNIGSFCSHFVRRLP